jgi:hypothetical protein
MSVNHVIEDNPILKSALENLGEEKAIAIKPIAILGESSPYEFNYVVHMDNYIHLPRRQKKDGRVSRHCHQRRGFSRQGQSHIAHRWEHLLRRRTLCCAYIVYANPIPDIDTTPRLIALEKSSVPETSNHQRTGVWGR